MERPRLLEVEVLGSELTDREVVTFIRVGLSPCAMQALREATAALVRERAERDCEETAGGFGEGAL